MHEGQLHQVDAFETFRQSVICSPENAKMRKQNWNPLFAGAAGARIAVIGQAPGRRAQQSGIPWDDASGKALIDWMGVTESQFRDPQLFALVGMDFYYPGRGRGGDLPPRAGFAERWHPPLFALMPDIRLTLLIGRYAQAHYLPRPKPRTLTEAVRNYEKFLPQQFPLVHPSPLNFRWQQKNPWFVTEVLPELRSRVRSALEHPSHDPTTGSSEE